MKKLLFVILTLLFVISIQAQVRGVRGTVGVKTITTTWEGVYVGSSQNKDVDLVSYETSTDTLHFAYSKYDTSSTMRARWRMLTIGQSFRINNFVNDTLWVKGTGDFPVKITADVR